MKNETRVAAIYARVSSEQQAEAGTIESQVEALKKRVAQDGLALPEEYCFIDAGYSGATMCRPALERLRDAAALSVPDRLYVYSPDRLARKYAYQVLLLEELQRQGVEVVFLNCEPGRSPEEDLLLQMQGMIAEYERAQILERSRRGKRHAARQGAVAVLSGAPYGYRFLSRYEGGGEARYEVVAEEAGVVRQIFDWVGSDRLSIQEVCRRLQHQGTLTRTGKASWDRSTVWGMLRNPAYQGTAAFGKTRAGTLRPRLRAIRGKPEQPRKAYAAYEAPREEWISIPVPPLVDSAVFAAVQEQLEENRRRSRQRARGARYLLQGLVVCAQCGYAYYGKPVSRSSAKGKRRDYAYYRCVGTDAYRFGGERVCFNKQVRTDLLEEAVWQDVRRLLSEPERLASEHQRRLRGKKSSGRTAQEWHEQRQKLKRGIGRLLDAYSGGWLEKDEFEPRLLRTRERLRHCEDEERRQVAEEESRKGLRLVIGRLQEFAGKVAAGMTEADWNTRREIIRTLVRRVEIGENGVRIVYRVGSAPFEPGPERGRLQDCWWRGNSIMRKLHQPLP